MRNRTYSITIGTLAQTCGVSTPTIRYYEQIGLMPKAERSQSDQRRYGRGDVDRLTFIRRCRAFGFSTKQVRSLLTVPSGSAADCAVSQEIARNRITEIQSKIQDLLALEKALGALVETCEATCRGQGNQVCSAYVDMELTV